VHDVALDDDAQPAIEVDSGGAIVIVRVGGVVIVVYVVDKIFTDVTIAGALTAIGAAHCK
jgi:hypothetical protein